MNIRSNPETTVPAVTTGPLPSSRKIFVTPDEASDVRVPLREIMLSEGAGEPNLPVYDTSGPYTDPNVVIDVNAGLPRGRIAWVKERGGVEEYQGRAVKPVDNGNVSSDKAEKAFSAYHNPLRGLDGHKVTQLEFARAGIITKEMIYVALRENLGRKQQLEGADSDRHRADLSGAGKGQRRSGEARLGSLQGHADRAVRAGRRLLHHPRRRAAALYPSHGQPRHRHRFARRLDHGEVVPGPSQ